MGFLYGGGASLYWLTHYIFTAEGYKDAPPPFATKLISNSDLQINPKTSKQWTLKSQQDTSMKLFLNYVK